MTHNRQLEGKMTMSEPTPQQKWRAHYASTIRLLLTSYRTHYLYADPHHARKCTQRTLASVRQMRPPLQPKPPYLWPMVFASAA
jgi:hypothetical protein